MKNLDLTVDKKVFIPTGTSEILIEAAKRIIKPKKKILDLGCGSGIVGISIAKYLKKNTKIYFSDISKYACKNTEVNCKKLKIKYEIKTGSILDPWKDYKFDFIISDVAAVADKASKISSWYKNCINNSGEDGTKHIVKLIDSVKINLNKNGIFLFPVISLSNEKKMIRLLDNKFKKISFSEKIYWPIPSFFKNKLAKYKNLKKKSKINFEEKFGIYLAYTYSANCFGLK